MMGVTISHYHFLDCFNKRGPSSSLEDEGDVIKRRENTKTVWSWFNIRRRKSVDEKKAGTRVGHAYMYVLFVYTGFGSNGTWIALAT